MSRNKNILQKTFKRAAGAVSTFVNAFVPNYEDKSTGIWKFGKDNLLPNVLLSYVADSGIATRCVGKVAEYIASDGFTETTSAEFKVNSTQTADQLLQEQAQYMAFMTGVAFHVSRKGGAVSEVKAVPVQCVRLMTDGRYLFNPTFGQERYDKSKDKHYPKYYGDKLPINLLTDPDYAEGEILYIYRKTPLNSYYPIPDFYAQIEDVRTSSQLSKMDLELAINGFMPSSIITIIGDVDTETKDANNKNKTELDCIREDFQKFTSKSESNGIAGRFRAWLNFAKTKEEAPVVQSFDAKSILEASNGKRDVIERAVCRLFGTHPVLLGYSDAAVLGNTQALANASLELNKVVNPYQRLLTDAFRMLYPNMDWTISEYMPITYIDPALFDKMTEDEIRNKLLGLPPKETDATGEGDKVIKAINSLSPLVANKVLESLTKDEIRALIGLSASIEEPLTPPAP